MITLAMTSASRPRYLKECLVSLFKNLDGQTLWEDLWILHEDVRDPGQSKVLVKYAEKFFDKVTVTNPSEGYPRALYKNVHEVKTPYMLHIEEDWLLLHPLDIDKVLHLMETYKNDINQIVFHKRAIQSEFTNYIKKEVTFGDTILTTGKHWHLLPSIWRMDYIKKFFKEPFPVQPGSGAAWHVNRRIKGNDARDADWNIKNMKSYYYGRIGSGHWFHHLGLQSSRIGG